jgi:hypothetical protein
MDRLVDLSPESASNRSTLGVGQIAPITDLAIPAFSRAVQYSFRSDFPNLPFAHSAVAPAGARSPRQRGAALHTTSPVEVGIIELSIVILT